MKIWLAIDTSTTELSMILSVHDQLYESLLETSNHESILLVEIDKILTRASVKKKDLECICVGVGPGSFTGLKVSAVTINALCFILKIPILTFSSMLALAFNHSDLHCPTEVILKANFQSKYYGLYNNQGVLEEKILSHEKIVVNDDMWMDLKSYYELNKKGKMLSKGLSLKPLKRFIDEQIKREKFVQFIKLSYLI